MRRTTLHALAFGVSVLLLSVGPLLLANGGLEEQHDAERALADLAQLEESLDEALLRARGGWDTDWDRVVAVQRSLLEAQSALGPHLERWENLAKTSLQAPALAYLNASRERGHAIEGFKTEFSVLRNSLRYLPTVAREALRAEPGSENVDAKLAISIVDAMESALGTGRGGEASQLDRFAVDGALEASQGSALANLFRHAQIAVEKSKSVDELLTRALDPESESALEVLRDRFDASLVALHRRRVISRAALSAIAVMLGGAVGYVSLRLRRDAAVLADLNAQLERRVQERTADLEREVANRRAAEEQAQRLALFDDLTSLPNRRLLRERLEHTLLQRERDGGIAAVLFLDLDGFKRINDTHGHDCGDALLVEVAQRLTRCVRRTDSISRVGPAIDEDVVSRQGGDEFVVLAAHVRGIEDAARIARRVVETIAETISIGGIELQVGASVGIALYPLHGATGDDLLKAADAAMYQAKTRHPGSYAFFDDRIQERVAEHLRIEQELQRAIRGDELVLHYQPKLAVRTGEIEGVEALVRWNHPREGVLLPNAFVPIAEKSDLIRPLGDWVLSSAFAQGTEWWRKGSPLQVAINVSARQLHFGEIEARSVSLLEATRLPAELIEMEITESCMVDQEEVAIALLRALRKRGFGLALDDFGTGYSSLSYLRSLPIDLVKIDRSFVQDLDGSVAIVGAVVQMAHSIGLRVVAEGVEEREQVERLVALGCDALQGFFLGPPVPADDVAAAGEEAAARFAEATGSHV